LLKKDKNVQIVYGQRQAGKTTLINLILKEIKQPYNYYTGDDLFAQDLLSQNNLEKLKRVIPADEIVFIDEAQKIKNIGLSLKLLHDNLDARLIVSGSASFDLANKLSEPLTGRTKSFMLYPLAFTEVQEKYHQVLPETAFEEMLCYGMLPKTQLINNAREKEEYLYEYLNNYLYKDILEFAGVRKPKKVLDLLQLLALQIGSEVSIAELSRSLSLTQKAVENYLNVLEKKFVIFNLRGFSRNLRKEISKTSKYYFSDLGIRNALIRNFNPLKLRSDGGDMFENYFIAEKIKYSGNKRQYANFYFWRTYEQKEIDLIEEREGKLYAFECKLSDKKTVSIPKDFSSTYKNTEFNIVNRKNYTKFIFSSVF
jgi:predicted AAA+ superfamily ATPase